LAPVLLGIRFHANKPSWWIILLMITGLGWLFISGSFVFYVQHIEDLVTQNDELPAGWDNDGASGMLALFFGWLLSLVYSLPWLVVYALASLIRKRPRKPSST